MYFYKRLRCSRCSSESITIIALLTFKAFQYDMSLYLHLLIIAYKPTPTVGKHQLVPAFHRK